MRELREYMRVGKIIYLIDDKNNLYYKKSKKSKAIKLSLFRQHFYNLRVYNDVPVLEIDGLRMQVMKGFKSPLDYSEKIAKELNIKPNTTVLDTCAGLGYTALAAALRGAKVTTFEYSDSVIELARHNPFSKELFTNKNITMIHGDISEEIKKIKNQCFNFVIHDPPRITHAPSLYSIDFYAELKRVLCKDGKLYHYVGAVGSKRKGRNIFKEVKKRLQYVGFKKIRNHKLLQGLFASA